MLSGLLALFSAGLGRFLRAIKHAPPPAPCRLPISNFPIHFFILFLCSRVTIDTENCSISVWNNGSGLPVQIHKKEKIYIPELVFGNLLTSDNYDDKEKKTTGGRNGYGAKLANIFSTKFVVETGDTKSKQKYKQIFQNNMSKKGNPKISENYTGIKTDIIIHTE